MALDFPNAPTLNQTVTAPNGVIWMWDGVKWTATTSTSPYVGGGNVGRNLLHNPLFNVAQRGAGPFTTNTYTLDRWSVTTSGGTIQTTSLPLSDADRAAIGDESAIQSYHNIFTGSAGASDFVFVAWQPIEGVRRLAGKTVTVSFWAKAAAGTPKLGVNFYQSFGTGGSPSAGVYATAQAFTLSTTWARFVSAPFALPSSSGKTLGTAGNDYTQMTFWGSAGASYNAIAGGIGVQSSTVDLWGVQLEVGSVATPLEKPDPRYDLSNCQRFYCYGLVSICGPGSAGIPMVMTYSFGTPMRAFPTIVWLPGGSSANMGSPTNWMVQVDMVALQATPSATGTAWINAPFSASADL